MAEDAPVRRTNEIGPTGMSVAANLRRLRDARGLSTPQLSRLLGEVGRPIQQSGITKIEKGDRKVDVDDLMALAVVLGVNPNALLLPPISDQTSTEITVAGEVSSWKAWRWADGQEPLKHPFDLDDFADFQMHARPKGKRRYQLKGERTREELAKRRADVEAMARHFYPDSPEEQNAFIQQERARDPEPWEEI